ncbi:MAG: hypothetical protein ACLTYN_11540 [Dysosmobacter welbionis]
MFRHLYRADGSRTRTSSPCPPAFMAGVATADMICTEAQYVDALAAASRRRASRPCATTRW